MTVILYLILVLCGWISIYAASYDFDNASIFDFAERSGKQFDVDRFVARIGFYDFNGGFPGL